MPERTDLPAPPPGRPLTAMEVRGLFFPGQRRSLRWIHRHVPRHELSPMVIVFYEAEVRAWIASRLRSVA